MFHDVLHFPVETPENPFVAPVNIEIIEAFMNRVGYQGVIDKDFMNNVNQKKEAIQYPRFIRLIIADLIKKFQEISQRIKEDYHSIKDDIPLVRAQEYKDNPKNMLMKMMKKMKRRDDDIHSKRHDDHQEDDDSPKGEKREWDIWVEEIVIDEDEVILEDETPDLITELQGVDKRVLTIYDYAGMKATLKIVK
ncbi:hypothetical protein Tco_0616032 [Tanacetum coccineum]